MLEAWNVLVRTHERYLRAYEAAMATDEEDQRRMLQQEGRAYAQVLTQYITSTTEWLGYAEVQLRQGKADSTAEGR